VLLLPGRVLLLPGRVLLLPGRVLPSACTCQRVLADTFAWGCF
jgi:hypothetical protein